MTRQSGPTASSHSSSDRELAQQLDRAAAQQLRPRARTAAQTQGPHSKQTASSHSSSDPGLGQQLAPGARPVTQTADRPPARTGSPPGNSRPRIAHQPVPAPQGVPSTRAKRCCFPPAPARPRVRSWLPARTSRTRFERPAERIGSRRPGHPDRLQHDRAMYAPAGKALALVLARETAHVQHVMRVASRYDVPGRAARCPQRPVRRRQRHRRLHPAQPREDEPGPRDRRRQPDRRHPARHLQRRPVPRGRRAGTVLSARPVELGVLLDRRQHLDQLRRPVLRQVRRHDRLRARPRGRAGRRRDPAHRSSHGQGRRRLRPDPAVRRQRGHARRRSPRSPCCCVPRPSSRSRWPRCSTRRRCRCRRSRTSSRAGSCRPCWSSWTGSRVHVVNDAFNMGIDPDAEALRAGPVRRRRRARGRRDRDAAPRSSTRPARSRWPWPTTRPRASCCWPVVVRC